MKTQLAMLLLLAAALFISCEKDDATGPSDDHNVNFSGGGLSAGFDNFEFAAVDVFGSVWLTIMAVEGPDTLVIMMFDFQEVQSSTVVQMSDSSLIIVGQFQSAGFFVTNFGGTASGGLQFTHIDTSETIAVSFVSNSSLLGMKMSDGSSFTVSVAGGFTATKAGNLSKNGFGQTSMMRFPQEDGGMHSRCAHR